MNTLNRKINGLVEQNINKKLEIMNNLNGNALFIRIYLITFKLQKRF